MYIQAIAVAHHESVLRATQATVLDLASYFTTRRRNDPKFFWEGTRKTLYDECVKAHESAAATAAAYVKRTAGSGDSRLSMICSAATPDWNSILSSSVREHLARAQFLREKTAEDRLAHDIPDVAVMMWFPDRASEPEQAAEAQSRYDAIRAAVSEATSGQATVSKIDDPSVVAQDRISPAVELWLEKAALVIVDLCGQRHNVYYELGYTRASGTDLIVICPEQERAGVRFHLSQWPMTFYESPAVLTSAIREKIAAVCARYDLSGPLLAER
jgi:hypothetical protein